MTSNNEDDLCHESREQHIYYECMPINMEMKLEGDIQFAETVILQRPHDIEDVPPALDQLFTTMLLMYLLLFCIMYY